jgi:hypothetical protein
MILTRDEVAERTAASTGSMLDRKSRAQARISITLENSPPAVLLSPPPTLEIRAR